jgi:hypothetical protein
MFAAANHAMGQTSYRFKLKELGVLPGQSPAHTTSQALGLNDKSEVVGVSFATASQPRGVVWLPNANYGLTGSSVQTLLSLNALASDGSARTTARDININGLIAGERQPASPSGNPMRAVVWTLSGSAATINNLGAFPDQSGFMSTAQAINDEVMAIVVGWSQARTCESSCWCGGACLNCGPGLSNNPNVTRGFRKVLDGTPGLNLSSDGLLPVDAFQGFCQALAVNFSGRSAGVSSVCNEAILMCRTNGDPATWAGAGSGIPLLSLPDCGVTNIQSPHEATGVNDEHQIFGWGREHIDGQCGDGCRERALVWLTPGSDPINLQSVQSPEIPTSQETRAEAINIPLPELSSCVQVVGRNITANKGVLWERNGSGTWTYFVLNDITRRGDCASGQYPDIRFAMDINNKGMIAVIVTVQVSPGVFEDRAGILLNVADITTDALVDGLDLGQVQLQWGCTGACSADINCDLVVDGGDIGQVLLNWGDLARPSSCSSGLGGGASGFAGGGSEGSETLVTPGFIATVEALLLSDQLDIAVALIESTLGGS